MNIKSLYKNICSILNQVLRLLFAMAVCLLAITNGLNAQQLNHRLRFEPVWARVADAFGEKGSVESVEFSPDGKRIISGTKYDNAVIMWRTSDGQELWRACANDEVERVGWSADGQFVAACSEDSKATVYNADDGRVVKVWPHSQGIDGLTWSNEDMLLATGEEGFSDKQDIKHGYIRIFDMDKSEEVKVLDFGGTVNELFFSSNDQYLLAVGHGSAKVYNTKDWTLEQTLEEDYYIQLISGAFSPDGKYVIATGHAHDIRGNIFLWDWKANKLVKRINHTGKKIESITFHPNGQYIVCSGHEPLIYIYRLDEVLKYANDDIPVAHKVWSGDNAEYIDFNKDGSFLVSAHQNGLIKLWVWMGEDPALNTNLHQILKKKQE